MTTLPPVSAERSANHVIINQKFGNPNVNGLQHKGAITIDNQPYFAKLDDLNPTVSGEWESRFDVQYSSVSEAISSLLVKNIQNKQDFDSVEYEFSTFNIDGKRSTGTISKNYLKENESEHILAIGRTVDPHTIITTDEYAEEIVDVSTQTRFDHFIKYFTNHNIPYDHAKSFLIQQAAFDIMTGNGDRLNNPSNFIIAYNSETKTGRLVNMDYGRTLPLSLWAQTAEDNFKPEFLNDSLDFYVQDLNSKNNSIISSLHGDEIIDFLNNNGFKPFEINIKQLKQDLKQLNDIIQNSDVPFKKFADVKIKSFEKALESPMMKQFYINSTKTKTIDFSQPMFRSQNQTESIKEKQSPSTNLDVSHETSVESPKNDVEFDL